MPNSKIPLQLMFCTTNVFNLQIPFFKRSKRYCLMVNQQPLSVRNTQRHKIGDFEMPVLQRGGKCPARNSSTACCQMRQYCPPPASGVGKEWLWWGVVSAYLTSIFAWPVTKSNTPDMYCTTGDPWSQATSTLCLPPHLSARMLTGNIPLPTKVRCLVMKPPLNV